MTYSDIVEVTVRVVIVSFVLLGFVVAAWLTNDDLGDAVGDDDAPYGM